jgi:hypothetical protein
MKQTNKQRKEDEEEEEAEGSLKCTAFITKGANNLQIQSSKLSLLPPVPLHSY